MAKIIKTNKLDGSVKISRSNGLLWLQVADASGALEIPLEPKQAIEAANILIEYSNRGEACPVCKANHFFYKPIKIGMYCESCKYSGDGS